MIKTATDFVEPERRTTAGRWGLVLGVTVSLICLVLVTRKVEWPLLLPTLRHVRPVPFCAGIAGTMATFIVIAYRWHLLLGNVCAVSVSDSFDFTMIGYLAGLIVPARLGDLAKVVLVARQSRTSRTAVLGTVVLERLCDIIMLLILAGIFAALLKLSVLLGAALLVLAAATLIAVAALWTGPKLWHQLLSPVLRRLPDRMARTAAALIAKFSTGVDVSNQRRTGAALLVSVLLWVLSGASMSAYAAAFPLTLPWYAGFLIILFTNLAGILPASPGGVGVYHYMSVLAVTVWTSDSTTALALAIVTHAVAMFLVTLTGAWGLARQELSFRALRESSRGATAGPDRMS